MYATATTAMTAEATAGERPRPSHDVEDDEALQAGEAELPERIDHGEQAQIPVLQEDRPKRCRAVGQRRVVAAALQPKDRQQRDRGGGEHPRSDEEGERLPEPEQKAAGQQRDPEAGAARDRLSRLRARIQRAR
jgi:hypothetical protein